MNFTTSKVNRVSMRYPLFVIVLLISIVSPSMAQTTTPETKPAGMSADEYYRLKYEERLTLSNLDGVYIPKDLYDAIKELKKIMPAQDLESLKAQTEAELLEETNKTLDSPGMWIRTRWSLYDGSRLSAYFRKMGLSYPVDLSGIILTAVHRDMHEKDLGIKELFTYFKERRATIIAQRKKEKRKRYSD